MITRLVSGRRLVMMCGVHVTSSCCEPSPILPGGVTILLAYVEGFERSMYAA